MSKLLLTFVVQKEVEALDDPTTLGGVAADVLASKTDECRAELEALDYGVELQSWKKATE